MRFDEFPQLSGHPKDPNGLVLHDVVFQGNLALPFRSINGQLSIAASVFNGGLKIDKNIHGTLQVVDTEIVKTFAVSGDVTGDLHVVRSRVHEEAKIKLVHQNAGNEMRIQDCAFDSSLDISMQGSANKLTIENCQIAANLTAVTVSGTAMNINTVDVGQHVFASSSSSASTLEITGAKCPKVTISNQWATVEIGRDCQIEYVELSNPRTDEHVFKGAEVGTLAYVGESVDLGDLVFKENSKITESVLLPNSKLDELNVEDSTITSAVFWNSKISGPITILRSDIGLLDLSTTNPENANLDTVRFAETKLTSCSFASREFQKSAKFLTARFESAPRFFGCKFKEDMSFPSNRESYGRAKHSDEGAYRLLRHSMEEHRDRRLEGVFFGLEQEAALSRLPFWSWDALFSRVYKWTSYYGNSIGRCLISLLAIWIAFGFGYAAALVWHKFGLPNTLEVSFEMSARQMFAPFFDLRSNAVQSYRLGWKLFWIAQSILSLAVIAELIVTIRWRFRRG